ncbi:hypothetical protein Tco_1436446 [Tanacetum coccineum]
MAGYKHNHLKTKSFEDIQMLFDKEMKRVNTFIDMNTELVNDSKTRAEESSSKRAGTELEPEVAKKQKIDDDQDEKSYRDKLSKGANSLQAEDDRTRHSSTHNHYNEAAKQLAARRNQERVKSILLLAIPDEYLLKFHNVADAKLLWEAIKSRFGDNLESKKM